MEWCERLALVFTRLLLLEDEIIRSDLFQYLGNSEKAFPAAESQAAEMRIDTSCLLLLSDDPLTQRQ